jgi:hypothetical protein
MPRGVRVGQDVADNTSHQYWPPGLDQGLGAAPKGSLTLDQSTVGRNHAADAASR